MEKHYVNQGMSNFHQGRSIKIFLLLLLNALAISILYNLGPIPSTVVILMMLIFFNSSFILYYRIVDTIEEAKLIKTIKTFDLQLSDFLSTLNYNLKSNQYNVNQELIDIISNLNLYDISNHINYLYAQKTRIVAIDLIYLSLNTTAEEKIYIYSKILELSINKYMETHDYIPQTFLKAELYKLCKDLVTSVIYDFNNAKM